MQTKRGVLVLLVIGVLVFGFAFVDASALEGETATESAVGTSQVSSTTASLEGPVTLYVAGNGWLERTVADSIAASLTERGATVTTVSTLDDPVASPVIAVDNTESQTDYVPFSPSSTVETRFAYVQSGNTTLARTVIEGEHLVVSNRDPYVIDGEVTVRDRTVGIATWPAHQQRVGSLTGQAIVTALEEAPGMDRPN